MQLSQWPSIWRKRTASPELERTNKVLKEQKCSKPRDTNPDRTLSTLLLTILVPWAAGYWLPASHACVFGTSCIGIPGVSLCFLTLWTSPCHAATARQEIRLGYLHYLNYDNDTKAGHRTGRRISGAITMAIEEVNADPDILPNHTLTLVVKETHGKELNSIRQTSILAGEGISAYIGPESTCVHEGKIAAAFNLPMISYFCASNEVSNRKEYPTFARTRPPDTQITKSVVTLLKQFGWNKVVLVHSNSRTTVPDMIQEMMTKEGMTVTKRKVYDEYFFHKWRENPFTKIVAETYTITRIYVMIARDQHFVGLLDTLQMRGLLNSGEYFVVGVHLQPYEIDRPWVYMKTILTMADPVPKLTREAFRSYLGIAPATPAYPNFTRFSEIVNGYLERPPFNLPNPYKHTGRIRRLRREAAYLYDATWIYARAAHRALENGVSPSDGATIINNYTLGQTYHSAMGYMNRIDYNGNAEGSFTLLARNKGPSQFGHEEWGLFPVGTFYLNQNTTQMPILRLHPGQGIKWVGGKPPAAEPECGFFGQKCTPEPSYTPQIVGGSIGGVVLVMLVVGTLVYRNWKYEQELASLLWKIDYREISHSITSPAQSSGYGRLTGARGSLVSIVSQNSCDLKQLYTCVGTYRCNLVAIKRVNKRHVDTTRSVRKELKLMRDLRHDNLNPFIGACVDPGKVCIVTEYCSRGSLQDILLNDDVKLDYMFTASLVSDIVKGMIYLHDSEIRSHGRLKSSNCVVDSRWVVKITDYGLWEFKEGAERDEDVGEHQYYQDMLWTAPEMLRSARPPPGGTQKGDIFSFAIILYEIHGRNGPYGDIEMSPKEIIQRVMTVSGDRYFRPKLACLGTTPKFITDVIKDCWNEDPNLRPDFKTVRNKLKPMQQGLKSNIFDNMIAILEKYATNLEQVVEERTDQLREEQNKTEELLHQMLPPTVADQLKLGKQVEAEAYDSVTIYFSDICGFTAMSSESSPMQVVDLLNDLYTLFDFIVTNYDVYKVETIGDAYMCVSGLPRRNGFQHAGEIASMSLQLLAAIKKFRIRHRPSDTLKLRIGIHSGSCAAGVVGMKMPRYCLFGDTVNTASRMESHGLPLKIHCSPQCKELLDILGGYHLEERGTINMKGKGELSTYWLTGEDTNNMEKRTNSQMNKKSPLPDLKHRKKKPKENVEIKIDTCTDDMWENNNSNDTDSLLAVEPPPSFNPTFQNGPVYTPNGDCKQPLSPAEYWKSKPLLCNRGGLRRYNSWNPKINAKQKPVRKSNEYAHPSEGAYKLLNSVSLQNSSEGALNVDPASPTRSASMCGPEENVTNL